MTNTLTPLIHAYVTARVRRGEVLPETGRAYRIVLSGLDASYGRRALHLFGPAAIDRYRETIAHLRPSTRREYLSTVKCFTRWLARQGHTKHDACAELERVRQPRRIPVTLTEPEVAKLLAAVAGDARSTAIAWLMVGLGLRCVEVSRLQLDDYEPGWRGQDATLRVDGKSRHERVLPVTDEVKAALDAYLDTVGRVGGPLIRSEIAPNTGLRPGTLGKYMRRWLTAAGVKVAPLDGRSAHGLRRTAGSDVMDRTGNVQIVQAMLGHRRIETTAESYLRPVPLDKLRDAMEGRTYDTPTDAQEAA